MPKRTDIKKILMVLSVAAATAAFAAKALQIKLAHNSEREQREKAELERLLSSYDLSKYTFTNKVTLEDRAIAHAFPELTLNTRFVDSDDELLSSFIHEQLHWYLRDHDFQQRRAVQTLRTMYPRVPVGDPEGADSVYSTYGHLVDCYLEIQADRKLIGRERTSAVIADKGHYLWIYRTILQDEDKIAAVVRSEGLEIN
ncbi:MAG TPA: hypothetical protein VMH00_15830 [Candidatus Limnocylindrales bacterium]|nr:hypothetical protein [Candidatus Limnocylindrales bacterium]